MKFGLVMVFAAAGVVVWVLAAVGALTIAGAVGADSPTVAARPPSLLNAATDDVPGADLAGLPRYPGSVRTEYRRAVWDGVAVTEVEYRTPASFGDVGAHYRDAFHQAGWSIDGHDFARGEWTYSISKAGEEAVVELEPLGNVIEVEIELAEAALPRSTRTGR